MKVGWKWKRAGEIPCENEIVQLTRKKVPLAGICIVSALFFAILKPDGGNAYGKYD